MTEQTIEYTWMKKIRNPGIIQRIRKESEDSNILQGKEAVQALYRMRGMEINLDDIPL